MIALASALCETNNVWKQWSLDRDGYTAWRVFLYLDEQYVQSIVASEVKNSDKSRVDTVITKLHFSREYYLE